MSFFLLPFLLCGSMAHVYGQDSPQASATESPSPALQVGDAAPKLSVDQWLKGTPVREYSRHNIYVIEFWATWCGPCLKAMPHLSELASRYAKDGLVVVALTSADEANTSEAVDKFVEENGAKYNFRFALSNTKVNDTTFMEAAGQNGLPCSFVVDRSGKIAFIGQPNDLDYVLERMVKGQWRGKEDADELKRMNESIIELAQLAQSDPEKAMGIIQHVRKVNTQRTKGLDFAYAEVVTLVRLKKFDEAKATIETTIADNSHNSDAGQIAFLCGTLASRQFNPDGVHRDYALQKLADAEKQLGDDWQSLLQVGMAYQIAEDQTKFTDCLQRAIALCPDPKINAGLKTALKLSGGAAHSSKK